MLQKLSNIVPADKCGVWLVRVIHTYTKLNRISKVSSFMKVSIRETKPDNWLRKKKKNKCLYVRSNHTYQLPSGICYISKWNNCMLLKKRLTPRGSKVVGPVDSRVRRKRARASFIKVI